MISKEFYPELNGDESNAIIEFEKPFSLFSENPPIK